MSNDGISTVADLRIVIDADTEKFANGIAATRDAIAKLTTDGSEQLGKFDGMFAKMGDFVGGLPGKYDVVMARLTPAIGQARAAYEMFKGAAEKMGLGEDVSEIETAFSGLFASIKLVGVDALEAAGYEAGNLRSELTKVRDEADKTIDKLGESKTVVGAAVARAIREIGAGLTETARGMEALTESQTKVQIKATEKALEAAKRAGASMTSTMGAFLENVEEAAAAASGEVDRLEKRLADLQAHAESVRTYGPPAPKFADMEKYIEALRRGNRELALRNEVLGKSRGAAEEHLAIRKAEIEAETAGKIISDERIEEIRREAAEKRKLISVEENYNEAKRRAAEQEREQDRNHKGIENLDAAMDQEIQQMLLKIETQKRGTEATAADVFEQKMLAIARRQNIDLTDEDVTSIRRRAREYQMLVEVQKTVQAQMELIRQSNQIISSSIASEFSNWTRGAEFDVKRMVANILAEMAKLTLQKSILAPLLGTGGSGGGILGDLLGSMLNIGGGREYGGRVDPGVPYIVGEKRPELFVPDVGGTIIPDLGRMGGGQTINLTINAQGATEDAVARLEARMPALIVETMADHRARTE